jgi:hypothetical protein
MNRLETIENHDFYSELIKDSKLYLIDKENEIKFKFYAIEIPEDVEFDELEYYIQNTGFYAFYFLKWLKQLDFGIEILSNYDYSKELNYNRIDHLTYNIENYIIRFQSISDRLIQLINGVFHLTINENNVNGNLVMSSLKVSRTAVPSKYSPIKKHLKKLYNERNTIIHRHSYLEEELRKLEMFYNVNKRTINDDIKNYRTQKLKDYIKDKREDYSIKNEKLFELIPALLDELLTEYVKQRNRLIKITRL